MPIDKQCIYVKIMHRENKAYINGYLTVCFNATFILMSPHINTGYHLPQNGTEQQSNSGQEYFQYYSLVTSPVSLLWHSWLYSGM